MSNDDAIKFADSLEKARANLASLPRGHVFRDVSVQYLALLEEWIRAINADDDRAKARASVMRDFLARLSEIFDRWCDAELPEPDHYAPRLQRQIARIRRRLRAE